jgi:hypothetical protein
MSETSEKIPFDALKMTGLEISGWPAARDIP